MEFVHGVSPADESTHQSNGAFKYDKMKAVELDKRDSPTEV